MSKSAIKIHEIRDPIHTFVRLETPEREVLNSPPYQRLRYIHQLALTYLVYPGACHLRFEHCLGVMELASRIFDVVTDPRDLHNDIREIVPLHGSHDFSYWRQVLRMAALCHDLGHLPFSHAAEDTLPEGWTHEDLSLAIIRSPEMRAIWDSLHLNPEEVGKLAVGPKHYPEPLNDWETLLSEIITGDASARTEWTICCGIRIHVHAALFSPRQKDLRRSSEAVPQSVAAGRKVQCGRGGASQNDRYGSDRGDAGCQR